MLCSLYTGHRWRRKQRNQPVGIRSESRVCVRACLCVIWSLDPLGRQHAPPQQVLAPRMQLGQAQFASADSCVRVAALAVGEVAPSLSAVQAGCLLPGEPDVPGLQLCKAPGAAQTPPSAFTLAGEAEPRAATTVGERELWAGRGGRRGGGETGPGSRCHAVPGRDAVPPVRVLRDVAGIHFGDGRLRRRVSVQVGAPGLVVVEVVVQGPGGAAGSLGPVAGLLLGRAGPQVLCRRGLGGLRRLAGRGRAETSAAGLAAASWLAAQLRRLPGGLHGVLHHEVQQALLSLEELEESGEKRRRRGKCVSKFKQICKSCQTVKAEFYLYILESSISSFTCVQEMKG